MADISFAQNLGSSGILVDGNAYTFDSAGSGVPTDLTDDVSHSGIGGLTYTNADPQGKTVYTIAERALSVYEFGTRGAIFGVTTTTVRALNFVNGAPTVNDDNTVPYKVGSLWIDAITGKIYNCTDVTAGAAVWVWRNTKGTLYPMDWGVFRSWGYDDSSCYINGKIRHNHQSGGATQELASLATNIVPGDYVTGNCSGNPKAVYFTFLPYTNP